MGFGNPQRSLGHIVEIELDWKVVKKMGVKFCLFSDTVGNSTRRNQLLFSNLIPQYLKLSLERIYIPRQINGSRK
jgi:hypothetical protein